MSGAAARTFLPLPEAPKAHVPVGITAEGAARVAWHPNVFQWVAAWRLIVVVEGLVAVLAGSADGVATRTLQLAFGYALVSCVLAVVRPTGRWLPAALLLDLVACVGLLAHAAGTGDPTTFSLLALYSFSTVVSWASRRPIDAFIGGGLAAAAYAALGATGPWADGRPAAYVSNLALYFFFALATSGFFTVAHRIGALEIATEISRERGRYRRDLHDRLGQALCGLHFELQAVHASGVGDGVAGRLQSLADGYRDARSMLADLFRQNDEPLVATNVGALIQQEARRMAKQTGARIDAVVDGDASRVPPWMRAHVWSIAGECMTNALKNGQATSIDIDLSVTEGLLVLGVTDDGIGFDNPPGTITEKEGHYGLREMAERARICGGEVVIASAPGLGTRVRLQVPLPEGGTADIIERDASRLRENVWTLFTVLRAGLGVVALSQLVLGGGRGSAVVAAVLGAAILLDIVLPTLRRQEAFSMLAQRPSLLTWPVVAYAVGFGVALAAGVTPTFLLYAPLVLLAAGIHGGRSMATRLTVLFAVLIAGSFGVVAGLGMTDAGDAQATLLYVTNMLIIGMSATQGAKLLDRLETLQIRVRYQALARLRQGLSTRMRDQLMERLDELERTARELATDDTPDAEGFAVATDRLQAGSSELKRRLREIVHQLADPTPGRTTAHV